MTILTFTFVFTFYVQIHLGHSLSIYLVSVADPNLEFTKYLSIGKTEKIQMNNNVILMMK